MTDANDPEAGAQLTCQFPCRDRRISELESALAAAERGREEAHGNASMVVEDCNERISALTARAEAAERERDGLREALGRIAKPKAARNDYNEAFENVSGLRRRHSNLRQREGRPGRDVPAEGRPRRPRNPHREHGTMSDIEDWQKRFRAAPRIWWTEVRVDGQWESTGEFYESREAAEEEVAFRQARAPRIQIRSAPIHTLALSQERWRRL